jgi:hypothetical protein
MSTDFDAVCDAHREYTHLGQHMGGVASFGYGSKDRAGREAVAEWIFAHLACGVRIVLTDCIPDGYRCIEPPWRDQATGAVKLDWVDPYPEG